MEHLSRNIFWRAARSSTFLPTSVTPVEATHSEELPSPHLIYILRMPPNACGGRGRAEPNMGGSGQYLHKFRAWPSERRLAPGCDPPRPSQSSFAVSWTT